MSIDVTKIFEFVRTRSEFPRVFSMDDVVELIATWEAERIPEGYGLIPAPSDKVPVYPCGGAALFLKGRGADGSPGEIRILGKKLEGEKAQIVAEVLYNFVTSGAEFGKPVVLEYFLRSFPLVSSWKVEDIIRAWETYRLRHIAREIAGREFPGIDFPGAADFLKEGGDHEL